MNEYIRYLENLIPEKDSLKLVKIVSQQANSLQIDNAMEIGYTTKYYL